MFAYFLEIFKENIFAKLRMNNLHIDVKFLDTARIQLFRLVICKADLNNRY